MKHDHFKILISSCTTGKNVRWNGKNKLHKKITNWAEKHNVVLIPVCPEDLVFGTPRQPIRLIQVEEKIRVKKQNGDDVTEDLFSACKSIFESNPEATGFIGISRSPSCGINVGVKNLGRTTKAFMHTIRDFPTVEINQLKEESDFLSFLKRVRKFVGKNDF